MSNGGEASGTRAGSGGEARALPGLFRPGDLTFRPRFAYGEQAEIAEISGAEDGTLLGTGLARFRNAAIPWTLRYDEALLVIEGRVTVRCGGGLLDARARDVIWLPAGSEVVYEAEEALVFYALWPADWAARVGDGMGIR